MTLLFDRTNWFIPQTITVVAPQDALAEGRQLLNIQHTVVQGASNEDGGAYDTLIVPGLTVEVIDDDTADVLIAPSGDGTLVAEGHNLGAKPASDTYLVQLTRKPVGEVRVVIGGDGEAEIQGTADYVHGLTLIFDETNWNTAQVVTIRAKQDAEKEGMHFSRFQHELLGTTLGSYFGFTLNGVAAGLAGAINGDLDSKLNATLARARRSQRRRRVDGDAERSEHTRRAAPRRWRMRSTPVLDGGRSSGRSSPPRRAARA